MSTFCLLFLALGVRLPLVSLLSESLLNFCNYMAMRLFHREALYSTLNQSAIRNLLIDIVDCHVR